MKSEKKPHNLNNTEIFSIFGVGTGSHLPPNVDLATSQNNFGSTKVEELGTKVLTAFEWRESVEN